MSKQVNLKYIQGAYPLTMQMYFDKFDLKMYQEVYDAYQIKYYGQKKPFEYESQPNDKYYLNFSAFLILDANQNIKAYAFEEFNDLVWIIKLLNINGLTLSLDENVFNEIKDQLDVYKCFKVEN